MIDNLELTKAITSRSASGFIVVQCQSLGTDGNQGYFTLHHFAGFRAQPRDLDGEEAGHDLLIGDEGTRGHAWLLEDTRVLPLLPDEGKGGSLQYAVTSSAKVSYVMAKGSDGSIVLHVHEDAESIRIEHGDDGPSIEVNKDRVELGGQGAGGDAVYDDGSFTAWVQAVSAACSVSAPSGFRSSKVKVKS